ncbi:MAG: hypothetical protein SF028_10035 [Candidatus Sumerlaeia bacterium]|nr:hypothetical protein [Candidatus Sumerlaeia bacterium]
MRASRIVPALLLAAVLGYGGYAGYQRLASGTVAVDVVPTTEVRSAPFRKVVTSLGQLEAANSSAINSPERGGKVVRMLAEGTRVEPGDPVIWLDTTEAEKNLEESQAQLDLSLKDLESAKEEYQLTGLKNQFDLESVRTEVKVAEQEVEDAKTKYEAEKVLVERGISPKTRLDETYLALVQAELSLRNSKIAVFKAEEDAASAVRVSQSKIDRAELTVERYRRLVKERRDEIDGSIIKAVAAGNVSYIAQWRNGTMAKTQEGDQLWGGQQIGEIPNTAEMHAVVQVHEMEVSAIERGQPVSITVEAFPGLELRGEVVSRSFMPSQASARRRWQATGSGPREFDIRIRLLDNPEQLRHGMTASASILVQSLDEALQVPLEALVKRGAEAGVVLAEDRRFVALEVLGTNDNFAAVKGAVGAGSPIYLRDPEAALPTEVGTGSTPAADAQGATGTNGAGPRRPS